MKEFYIINEDVARFMNDVKPISASVKKANGVGIYFKFDDIDDYDRAEKWYYSNYEIEVIDGDNVLGSVYYHENCGYSFFCDADEHEERGFSTPEKAEDALFDYAA